MQQGQQAPRVLVVEDDPEVAAIEIGHLQAAGVATVHLQRGDQVEAAVRADPPDLVLLDLMLPGLPGTEVCKALRTFSAVPVVMVTARAEEIDRLLGFDCGADDYLRKPFSPRELVARVLAVLRRAGRLPAMPATATPPRLLELDAVAQRALVQGRPLELTPQEYRLLAVLAAQPGRVFSRAQLIAQAYDDGSEVFDRAVDSHVKNLRRKLAAAAPEHGFIHSVYGVGYRFELVAGKAERAAPAAAPAEPAGPQAPVLLDPALRPRLAGFLASRQQLLDDLAQAGQAGDLEAARRLAHRLAGSFALYGFTWAARTCLQLEHAPQLDPGTVADSAAALRAHLTTVRIDDAGS